MKTNKPLTYEVTIKRSNSSYDDVRIVSVPRTMCYNTGIRAAELPTESKNSVIQTTLELFPSTKIVSIRICEQW